MGDVRVNQQPLIIPNSMDFGVFVESLVISVPFVSKFFPEGVGFFITDLDKFLYVSEGFDFQVPGAISGQQFTRGQGISRALDTGVVQITNVPSRIYGVALKSITIPVKLTNGQVVGTYGVALPREVAAALEEGLEVLGANTTEMAASAISVGEMTANTAQSIDEMKGIVEGINEIVAAINKIADAQRLIALNAAIEAARATQNASNPTEAGNGRARLVVAEEFQKTADETRAVLAKIQQFTDVIIKQAYSVSENAQHINGAIQEQSQAIQEITARIEEMAALPTKI